MTPTVSLPRIIYESLSDHRLTPSSRRLTTQVTDPVEWAVESHAIVEAHVYDYHGDVVGDEYDQAHDHIWIERLAMGGVRLAALLNALLQ
jgi:hypothetical protein